MSDLRPQKTIRNFKEGAELTAEGVGTAFKELEEILLGPFRIVLEDIKGWLYRK